MIEKQFNIAIDADLQTTSDGANPGGPPINKDLYLQGVRTDLARILKSEAGRHLAASLRYHRKEILLILYPGQDGNAQEWWWGSSPKDNYSVVRFTPASGRSPCGAEIRKKRPATLPHEVLFHEWSTRCAGSAERCAAGTCGGLRLSRVKATSKSSSPSW